MADAQRIADKGAICHLLIRTQRANLAKIISRKYYQHPNI